jgi:hypothetical protein
VPVCCGPIDFAAVEDEHDEPDRRRSVRHDQGAEEEQHDGADTTRDGAWHRGDDEHCQEGRGLDDRNDQWGPTRCRTGTSTLGSITSTIATSGQV